MAADIRELMATLGHDRAAVIGHDRGARVGLRQGKDHPDFVERLAVLDNIPTRVIFETMNGNLAKGQWWFLVARPATDDARGPRRVRARLPAARRGDDTKLGCPVLALWGADFEWVGRAYDVAGIWAGLASDLRTVEIADCRHLPHEERPEEVNAHLLDFLAGR